MGQGIYLPQKILTNADLAKRIDTSDEWIEKRTGIQRRHIAAENECTSHLATQAAKAALQDAKLGAEDVDCIIVATTTPDHTFPSVATQVQANIGMEKGYAFDIQAACSGFLYALSLADSMIKNGGGEHILVIGADTMSRILDWEDRATCVLFGDGAGAVILKKSIEENRLQGTSHQKSNKEMPGILGANLCSDGRLKHLLYADGGPSLNKNAGVVQMLGKEVFRHAVSNITQSILDLLEKEGMQTSDIDWFIPHQANARILKSVAQKLRLPPEKIIITIADHANTSAASVPLALDQGIKDGRVQRGDLLMFEAMGGGFTWGALAMRW